MKNKNGREKFNRLNSIILFLVKVIKILPLRMRLNLLSFFQNLDGIVGIGIRYILLKSVAKKCGHNVAVKKGVYLFSPENLIIGDNVSFHPMCYIDASGGIKIGDNVSIAHGATILSTSHGYQNPTIPIKYQPFIYKETSILDNVWIGSKATILCGVTINEGCIVGANSLVTKDTGTHEIVGGVPAKVLKKRF